MSTHTLKHTVGGGQGQGMDAPQMAVRSCLSQEQHGIVMRGVAYENHL